MHSGPSTPRNILVVAYYFSPMGLSGVQRTLKFVKYLPQFGWKPTVLTVTPTGYFAQDPSLLDDLDGLDIEIVRAGSLDPNRLFRKKGTVAIPSERVRRMFAFMSDLFFIPDNKIGWKRKAVQAATELYGKTKFDVIFATAPPFTDFLIGEELHRKFGTPLVLDYRDPWHVYPFKYFPTPYHRMRHTALERKALQASSRIITTNRRVKELILKKYEFLDYEDIIIIPQGYDPADFNGQAAAGDPGGRSEKFVITHTGVFNGDRTPKYFFLALKKIADEHPAVAKAIEARFVGNFQEEFRKLFSQLSLDGMVTVTGYLSHKDSVAELKKADLVWFMNGNDTQSPGKVYEYIGARKPMLACVPDGFLGQLVTETGAGKVVGPFDVDAIAAAILEFYELYRQRRLPRVHEHMAQKFDRVHLTHELSKILGFLAE